MPFFTERAGNQMELIPGAGHGHVKQAAFTLQEGLGIVLGSRAIGQVFLLQSRQYNGRPLQALGTVDGGEQGAALAIFACLFL